MKKTTKFNASAAAMAFGKQPLDWLELIEGLTYVAAIKKIFLTERDKPIIAR